jgi:hypothetical protein
MHNSDLCLPVFITTILLLRQWRTKFRTAMNEADNASSTVAVDSLLNYEVIPWLSITLVSGPPFYPLIQASSYQS